MKIIGGEIELQKNTNFQYLTDSGRSSLRLILKSHFLGKKVLLPDFLCESVMKVVEELQIKHDFYHINSDLSIDSVSLKNKDYDAFYVINYFGQRHNNFEELIDHNACLVEDNVFLPVFDQPSFAGDWVGFNSMRKISPLADGSVVKSTFALLDEGLKKDVALFAAVKYEAKASKYDFINNSKGSEEGYLKLFAKAEQMLDKQKDICSISKTSLFELLNFMEKCESEYAIRKNNLKVFYQGVKSEKIDLSTDYPCFGVLLVDKRDQLREYLFSENVFLPVHWPQVKGCSNDIYKRIISVPLDSRFDEQDMKKIAALINDFEAKGK